MRFLIIFFSLISMVFSAPNITSYLYELRGNKLILIQQSNKPILTTNNNQGVINLERGNAPTEEQLAALKQSIIAKSKAKEKTVYETEILTFIKNYLKTPEGKTLIKETLKND